MRSIVVALLVSLAVASAAMGQVVVNPRLTTDSSIDCSSAEAVVKQIVKPGMTDEEKAVACWRFMLGHYYHWYPPYEDNAFEPVRDFAKAVNSYGYGPCFVNAPVLTALWEAAGFKTRSWTITGHSIPEVFYGGAWHMLDADARAWHRKADGQIAGVEDLAKDMSLFTNPPGKSDPYYPFGAPDVEVKPLDPWGPPSKMMDLYRSTRDNYRYNKRAVLGHPMYVALRQGETLSYGRDNVGKWFVFDKLPKEKIEKGPVNVTGEFTYGNGTLVWKPDLRKIKAQDLFWAGTTNVHLADGKIAPADAAKPACAVFRVFCPWVLVEAKATVSGVAPRPPLTTQSAEGAALQLSLDGGRSWSALDSLDLTRAVAGKYEYLLRVDLSQGAIDALAFENLFQVAQLSLPVVKPGANRVTVFRGPDEGVTQLVLLGSKAAKERYVFESKGLNVPNALTAVKKEEPGYVVFKMTAPDAFKALSIGGNIGLSRGPVPFVQAEYSLDAGKTWTQAFKLERNQNSDNAQFEEDVKVDLPENESKEALVKFTIAGDSKHAPGLSYGGLDTLRLYGYYRLPQPPGVKVAVDLVWQEKTGDQWTDKHVRQVVEAFPFEFPLTASGQDARFKSVTFSLPE
jgi:hypothetical protein